MSQRHYLLGPSSGYPSRWGFFCPYSSLFQGSGQWKLSTGQISSKFSSRLWREFLGTSFPLLFPPVLQLSLPGCEPDQNPGCPAQALRSYCKNSVMRQRTEEHALAWKIYYLALLEDTLIFKSILFKTSFIVKMLFIKLKLFLKGFSCTLFEFI